MRLSLPLALAAAAATAPATPPMQPAVSTAYQEFVRVDLVQLNFLARDARGRPVTDLKADDIEVVAGGRKQEIAFLQPYYTPRGAAAQSPGTATVPAPAAGESGAQKPAAPPARAGAVTPGRWVILFFDSASAGPATMVRAVEAARAFVTTGIRAGDQVAVVLFDGQTKVIQSFTTETAVLEGAVARVASSADRAGADRFAEIETLMDVLETCQSSNQEACAQRHASAYVADRLREADGLLRALILYVRALTPIPDIKTLVLFSEGFSRSPASDTFDAATVVLGTSVASRMLTSPDPRLERSLAELTQAAAAGRTSIFTVNPGAGSRPGAASAARKDPLSEVSNPGQIDAFRRAEQNMRFGLTELARLTGGVANESPDVGKALREVIDLAPGLYTVGFIPAGDSDDVHDVRIRVKRKGVEVQARREVPLAPSMPPLTGSFEVEPLACDTGGRRQATVKLRLDRNRLVFEKVDKQWAANFSLFLRVLAPDGGAPLYERYHFYSIVNTPEEVSAGHLPDPALEMTLALPCRGLVVLATVMDAAGGGRGAFEAQIAP